MKRVYIAHPLRGNVTENIQQATDICLKYARQGEVIPLSPLHAFQFLDITGDQVKAMQMCFELLAMCDELWIHGPWWTSEGCQAEICFAGCRDIPVRFK
ncbi:MAG: hypothetical protein H6Q73_3797 [Firmicutes bacterium]|nr:hypothetical protein [Bacillota bacterium]